MRVRQALKRKQEIIQQGKAKRQQDSAEITKLKGELAGDAANLSPIQATHTAFMAQESARQAKDTAQLSAAKAAASAQGAAAAAPAAAESDEADAGKEAAAAAAAADEGEKAGCEPVPCKGEAGETVEVNHNGAGEWKSGTIEALNGDGTYTVTFTDTATEKDNKVTMANLRAPVVDCGGSPSDIDEHATADCDETKCGAICVSRCNAGYEGASVEYSCSGKDAAWVKTAAAAETDTCKLLAPEVPYVEKVTAEDSSLKVSFASSAANEATYIVNAVPQTAAGGAGAAINTEITSVTSTSGTTETTVSGLTNGVEYLVTIEATNSRGTEEATAYSPVAPTDVKQKFDDVTTTKSAKETAIKTKEEKLKRDWGPDMQYSQMDGNCVEKEASKFVYKICALEKVEQKDGASWTNLGTWSGWDHEKKEMKFKQGTKCWNGPQRSATVEMVCGPEDEILSVAEPETCEYVLKLATPSVCTEADLPKLYGGAGKDEL